MTNRKKQQSKRKSTKRVRCYTIAERVTHRFHLRTQILALTVHRAQDGRARISLLVEPLPKGRFPPEQQEMAETHWMRDVEEDLAKNAGYNV